MAQPTVSDVHIDGPLTDLSVAHFQDASAYIADKVFPTVNVSKKSDKYYVWDKAAFTSNGMKKRAPGTESAGGGLELSDDNYFCEVWSFHKDIDDETRANEDAAVGLDRATTIYLAEQARINLEVGWANKYFITGVWSTEVDGTSAFTQWNNSNSDPEKNIMDAKRAVLLKSLQWPNTLVVSLDVHQALKRHPLIKDRIKYTSSESITEAIIAKYFEVDRYLVSRAVITTSAEGAATDTFDFTMGKHALLCYTPRNPGLMVPASGYTFSWSGFKGVGGGMAIKKFRMENIESDRLEIGHSYDQKVVSADCGYFFLNAVA